MNGRIVILLGMLVLWACPGPASAARGQDPDLEKSLERIRLRLSAARASVVAADARYRKQFLGKLVDRNGDPRPEEHVLRTVRAQKERLEASRDYIQSAYLLAKSGRIAKEAFPEKTDEALLESVAGTWSLDRDEARLTIELLTQEHSAGARALREELQKGGADAKPGVVAREKELNRKIGTRFDFLAKDFAKRRLRHVRVVKR